MRLRGATRMEFPLNATELADMWVTTPALLERSRRQSMPIIALCPTTCNNIVLNSSAQIVLGCPTPPPS